MRANRGAMTSATSTSATSGPCPRIWANCSRRYDKRAGAGNEHRPTQDRAARPISRSTARALNKVSQANPFKHQPKSRPRSRKPSRMNDMTPIRITTPERLGNRSGSALVPRLRRLCDPEGGAADDARDRRDSREHRVRQRHRLLVALPLLHGDLRLPHDPRPRARGRDRREARQPRARRLDHHRRRRCAVDRRQPHDAPHPPQPRLPGATVQQRDLRAHQGTVLADQPDRHAFAVDALWIGRPAGEPLRLRARRRRPLHRARHRYAQEPARRAQARACQHRHELCRDLPELHRLQRRRVRGVHRQEGCARQPDLGRARAGL